MTLTLVPQDHGQRFDPSTLHILVSLTNPVGYLARIRLARKTIPLLRASGATVHVIEGVYGGKPPEIADPNNPDDMIVHCNDEIWMKENLLNLGAQLVGPDAKGIMWCDADIEFHRSDWATAILEALTRHPVVQPFSDVMDLRPDGGALERQRGFAYCYRKGPELGEKNVLGGWEKSSQYGGGGPLWHPGYTWAWTPEAWDAVGGMIDRAVAGSADHHMSCCLIGRGDFSMRYELHSNYKHMVMSWQERAERVVKRNIGYVAGIILHGFHGHKENRKYIERRDILTRSMFDPYTDVHYDRQGVLRLTPAFDERTQRLRDDLYRYFRSRKEDGQ